MFIYPENLRAKPMLWLWELRDIGIIGIAFLLSVLALSQGVGMVPLVITVLFSFLTIRVDGSSILDLESPSGRMWRAAIPDIVFITSELTENSMCSRRPSICSPSSPCIQKIGNLITMWPVAEHLQSL